MQKTLGIVFDLFRVFFNHFKKKTMQSIQKITILSMLFCLTAFANLKASNDPIIVTHPASIAPHLGTQAALNVKVADNLKVVYQWQKSTNNATWFNIQGANQATYAPQTKEVGKAFYRVLITTIEENARAVDSKSAEVTVRKISETDLSAKK